MPDHPFTLLSEVDLHAARQKIIAANGDMEAAGITLEEMRNIIYTCRMKANPMQDQSDSAPQRKTREPSTNKAKLSGADVDKFLE